MMRGAVDGCVVSQNTLRFQAVRVCPRALSLTSRLQVVVEVIAIFESDTQKQEHQRDTCGRKHCSRPVMVSTSAADYPQLLRHPSCVRSPPTDLFVPPVPHFVLTHLMSSCDVWR